MATTRYLLCKYMARCRGEGGAGCCSSAELVVSPALRLRSTGRPRLPYTSDNVPVLRNLQQTTVGGTRWTLRKAFKQECCCRMFETMRRAAAESPGGLRDCLMRLYESATSESVGAVTCVCGFVDRDVPGRVGGPLPSSRTWMRTHVFPPCSRLAPSQIS